MLDKDLARLYQVSTKRLNEQVKRNLMRFPDDFMFQLTKKELGSYEGVYKSIFLTDQVEPFYLILTRDPDFVIELREKLVDLVFLAFMNPVDIQIQPDSDFLWLHSRYDPTIIF